MLQIYMSAVLLKYLFEESLAWLNHQYIRKPEPQAFATKTLGVTSSEITKALQYQKHRFGLARVANLIEMAVSLGFLTLGGLGWTETAVGRLLQQTSMENPHPVLLGVSVIGTLSGLSWFLSLPFSLYGIFVIEQRHGFNRQTFKSYVADILKGLILGVALGGPFLALLVFIVRTSGQNWWLLAWAAVVLFSLLTVVLYPTLLAPFFNKFRPLDPGELKDGIDALAVRVGFQAAGVFVMDASKRSSHGNAYFTGLFGARRIVLFDTLVKTLSAKETLAVLAHELGHFKLKHIRNSMLRSVITTGLMFYVLAVITQDPRWFEAFGMSVGTGHGTLILCGMLGGILQFPFQPLSAYISRRNEFAADHFAKEQVGNSSDLRNALLRMREESKGVPFAHPIFSSFYYSHPPLVERLAVL